MPGPLSLSFNPFIILSEPKKKILCVEDHADLCELITLDLPEYEVIGVYSKADALNKATGDQFDLYLLDYHLPDGTGEAQRSHNRDFSPTRIDRKSGSPITPSA